MLVWLVPRNHVKKSRQYVRYNVYVKNIKWSAHPSPWDPSAIQWCAWSVSLPHYKQKFRKFE